MDQPLNQQVAALEAGLNHFNPEVRTQNLAELTTLAAQGAIQLAPETDVANMHCHTFFSFDAYGYSPSALAWQARRRGIRLLGIIDFDVLDGVDEFLHACELVGVRGSAGIETRVFIPEFVTREINSPGEPGVCYHMGIGFTSSITPIEAAATLADLWLRSNRRNRAMIERINAYLAPITIDYDHDVLPLTPASNPTERHMLLAYTRAVERSLPDPNAFWAAKLDLPLDQIAALASDLPRLHNLLRTRLMKRGGVGYMPPGPENLPTVEAFHTFVVQCGAIPCVAWLDGTSTGEQMEGELLELLIAKGVAALNIIPDRNWNIADTKLRRAKLKNLYDIVWLAQDLDLPINVGTELNSAGQKLIDDFDAPELALVRAAFLDGAYFIYGHTALQQALNLGYQSAWARELLPSRRERNTFYTALGRLVLPGAGRAALRKLDPCMTPDEIIAEVRCDR